MQLFVFIVLLLVALSILFLWMMYYLLFGMWIETTTSSTSEIPPQTEEQLPSNTPPQREEQLPSNTPPQTEEKIPQVIIYFKQLWTGTPKINTCDEFNNLYLKAISELQNPANVGEVNENNMLPLIKKHIDPKVPNMEVFYNTLFEKMVYQYECLGFPGKSLYDAKPLLRMMIEDMKVILGRRITDCNQHKTRSYSLAQKYNQMSSREKQLFNELLENRIQNEIDEEYSLQETIFKVSKMNLEQCGW